MTNKFTQNAILFRTLHSSCLVCETYLSNEKDAVHHIKLKEHKKNLDASTYLEEFDGDYIRKVKRGHYCELCNKCLSTLIKVRFHVSDNEHIRHKGMKLFQQLGDGVIVYKDVAIKKEAWHGIVGNECIVCDVRVYDPQIHITSTDHFYNLVLLDVEFGIQNGLYRTVGDSFQCLTCNKIFNSPTRTSVSFHFLHPSHQKRYLKLQRIANDIKNNRTPEEFDEFDFGLEEDESPNHPFFVEPDGPLEQIIKKKEPMDKYVTDFYAIENTSTGRTDIVVNMQIILDIFSFYFLTREPKNEDLKENKKENKDEDKKEHDIKTGNEVETVQEDNEDEKEQDEKAKATMNKKLDETANATMNKEQDAGAKAKVDEEQDGAKASMDKEQDDAKASMDKEQDGAKTSMDKEQDGAKASMDKEQDGAKTSMDKEQDGAKASIDKEQDGAKASMDKEQDGAKASMDKEQDGAKASMDKEQDGAKASMDKDQDGAKASMDKEQDGAKAIDKENENTEVKEDKEQDKGAKPKVPKEKHQKTKNKKEVFKCEVCEIKLTADEFDVHKVDEKHVALMRKTSVIILEHRDITKELIREVRPNIYHCGPCNLVKEGLDELLNHLRTSAHMEKILTNQWRLRVHRLSFVRE